jgi:hypothetical protein
MLVTRERPSHGRTGQVNRERLRIGPLGGVREPGRSGVPKEVEEPSASLQPPG